MVPLFGRSHYRVLAKLGKELVTRGHEVLLFVGDCYPYAAKDANIRWFKCPKETKNVLHATNAHNLPQMMQAYCDAKLSDRAIINEFKSADLVIGDGMYLCSFLIADKFALPHVAVLESSLTSATGTLPYNVAELPSYIPQYRSGMTDNMSFLQRAKNTLQWLVNRMTIQRMIKNTFLGLKTKHQITPEKSLEQTFQKVDLLLVQTEAFEYPRPLFPDTKLVGPLLSTPAKPLLGDLENFVRGSGDEGVILVSFGTILGEIDETLIATMAAVFSSLPQRVIWKLNTEGKSLKIGSNVKVASWLPQNDILGHPKTRLFIGHAGMNGMLEAGYHGVPMICVPFFGDQFDNAVAAKNLGMAEILHQEQITEEKLIKTINTILQTPSYRASAARISKSIRLHPRTPVQQAADWVEYTQAKGSLAHLRPRGLDLPFYQLYLLDILFVAFLLLMGVFVAVYLLVRCFCQICCKKKPSKEKPH